MVVRGLLVLVGTVLGANAIWLLVTANLNGGVVMQSAVAVLLVAFGCSARLSGSRWVSLPAIGLAAVLAITSTFLALFGISDDADYREDALVVLGAAVHGRTVSPSLAQRLDVAVDYHERNPGALLVVTGGQGPQEDLPEALAAKRYLIEHGVPAASIVVEDRSTSTAENFRFAKKLLDNRLRPGYRIAFVTNEYHVWRASRAAARAGLDASHLHTDTRWYVWPSSYLRESVAAVWSWTD